MTDRDPGKILARIRRCFERGEVLLTQHARREMAAEKVTVDELVEAVSTATLLEDYPEHRRGPCGLLSGETPEGRSLHIVCTTDLPHVVVITVYEPMPPKWVSPLRRREKP